ncbi:uncharacterized protein METZ01_LOCUS337950, partial [marine metagenome]
MNSLIDFKEFDKINHHFAKDINKVIYDFSIDYPLNIFPKIIEYFRKNITCKIHLDYRVRTVFRILIQLYVSIKMK